MIHKMKLDEDSFERVTNGKKVVEVRLNDLKRQKIEIGDEILFKKINDLNEHITTKVIGLSKFNSFKDLFSVFGTKPFGHPENFTIQDQVNGVREAYSEEKENEFGVLGIHIKLISPN